MRILPFLLTVKCHVVQPVKYDSIYYNIHNFLTNYLDITLKSLPFTIIKMFKNFSN